MINGFIIRKWAALLIAGLLPTIGFFIILQSMGFMWSIIGMLLGAVVGVIIAIKLLRTPFTDMLEGKGILAIDVTSTGIMTPTIVGVNNGYLMGKGIKDVFDRNAVLQMNQPKIVKDEKGKVSTQNVTVDQKTGKLTITLDQDEYNNGRFALMQYPVILYNSQLKTTITKDFLSKEEKTAFAEHQVLFLNRTMEELTGNLRDFGRYIVEQLKPQKSIMTSWVFWIVIGVVGFILVILFGPALLDVVSTSFSAGSSAVNTASGGVVTPR